MNCSLTNYWEKWNTSRIIEMDAPPGCHPAQAPRPYLPHNHTDRHKRLSLNFDADPTKKYFLADLDELHTMNVVNVEDEISEQVCGDRRNHFWFLSGHQDNRTLDSLTLPHCTPYIEALYVAANFSLPSAQLIGSTPHIVPDEDSAVFLSRAPNATSRPWDDVSTALRYSSTEPVARP